jgi:hypothetical protein
VHEVSRAIKLIYSLNGEFNLLEGVGFKMHEGIELKPELLTPFMMAGGN